MNKYLATTLRIILFVIIIIAANLRILSKAITPQVDLAVTSQINLFDSSVADGTYQPKTVAILLDDFIPQPYQGNQVYFYNRMDGDRGSLNDTIMDWGSGYAKMTIAPGLDSAGMWLSLNHPIREGLAVNFSGILPAPINFAYQTRIKAVHIHITEATPNSALKIELKNVNDVMWSNQITLTGADQNIDFDLPMLGDINHLVLVLDHGQAGDFATVSRISFTAESQVNDTATAGFVWSYGMLLQNWNPTTGLVRDKAKDASGEFDALQSTGSLAAATADAEQLGIISHTDAVQIVNKIDAALLRLPRLHGLWPHWVKTSGTSEFTIVKDTEWSSVDTVIAALGLLEAQSSLGLDTSKTEQVLKGIDWDNLVTANGISHGYTYDGALIPYAWDVFGGESWLVQLAYASATGQIAPLAYPSPPTANGSGFIDELAWLFVPPPVDRDYWGTDWAAYRESTANHQVQYYPTNFPAACFAQLGLFGLSAGEAPAPWMAPGNNIYQAYGVGGAFAATNDGTNQSLQVVAPHYSAMLASLHPKESLQMWTWLIDNGYFTPLNNVESLGFPDNSNCDPKSVYWNQLKGSWNLSLQTLGWGNYLAQQAGKMPILWQTATTNLLLKKGYHLLASKQSIHIPLPTPQPSETPVSIKPDTTNTSCDGKPFEMWNMPGTYLYQSGNNFFHTAEEAVSALATDEPPGGNAASITVTGIENITTSLGTFQATRLDAKREYSILTGRLDLYEGVYKRSAWYVCGYGLIKLSTSDNGIKTPGDYVYSKSEEVVLISFTPLNSP